MSSGSVFPPIGAVRLGWGLSDRLSGLRCRLRDFTFSCYQSAAELNFDGVVGILAGGALENIASSRASSSSGSSSRIA